MTTHRRIEAEDAIIGRIIRDQRKSRHESLEALGAALGVTYQQVQKYETGTNRISASTLYRLCDHWGVSSEIFRPHPTSTPSDAKPSLEAAIKRAMRNVSPSDRESVAAIFSALLNTAKQAS